jgi:prolyl oligopeptidase
MARAVPLLALLLALFLAEEPERAAKATKRPITDAYHGIEVTDDYRWLEDADSPAVRKWVKEQNRYTRAALDAIPARAAIRDRLKQLAAAQTPRVERVQRVAGKLFAIRDDSLVLLASPDEPKSARVLFDPEEVLPKKDANIDVYEPSPGGKLVAVAVSVEGCEEGTVQVIDTATGKELGDSVPRVTSASGGSLAWKADGSGFYYTRHLSEDEASKQGDKCRQPLYFHKLGAGTEADACVFGNDLPRLASIMVDGSDDGRWIIAGVQHGTDDEYALHLLSADGTWRKFSDLSDRIVSVRFGPDDTLWLISQRDAPRGKLLRLSLKTPDLSAAETIVPQSDGVLRDFVVTPRRLCILDRIDGGARVRVFDTRGKETKALPLPAMSSVSQFVRLEGDEVLVQNESYLKPPAWLRVDLVTGQASRTALSSGPETDFSDCEVLREFALSRDGTKIPLTILRRKDAKLDGRNPTLLRGYGGYGENEQPQYQASRRVWLEQDGVYAIAHVRGDGEFGADWHHAGRLTKKQNAVDDFAACARHLIDRKYTCSEKLAIEGGSNGGLLVAAALTQQPELFRAAVAHVGIYDMLRYERHPNGVYSRTEFGSIADREQFQALYAYSPYHLVKDGTAYPAVLLLTGINDRRVPPSDSWKMAARLQAATASDQPVRLWTSFKSGHDVAGSEQLTQTADVFAFLFQQLGVKYRQEP